MASKRQSIRASFSSEAVANGTALSPHNFKNQLSASIDSTWQAMEKIWQEAGYTEEEQENLLGCFLTKLQQVCTQELVSEEKILEHAKSQAKADFAKYCQYCVRLGKSYPENDADMGTNLTDKLAELETRNEIISQEVAKKEALLQTAISEVNAIAASLGVNPPSADQYEGPSGTPELSEFRIVLLTRIKDDLMKARETRLAELKSAADSCLKCLNDMNISTIEELTATITPSKEDEENENNKCTNFNTLLDALVKYQQQTKEGNGVHITSLYTGVHTSDVALFKLVAGVLDKEKQRRKVELASTGSEIARLWTLLRIPTEEREAFQGSFQMNLSKHTLSTGHCELSRLQTIRKESYQQVVSSIRADILGLWTECDGAMCNSGDSTKATADGSEEPASAEAAAPTDSADNLTAHREEFPLYFVPLTELEETAVEAHEAYFTLLKTRVEELRPLFSKLARRETIVAERVELEHIQLNPERLTARGPKAREDRKREEAIMARVKTLDKLTKEVTSMINAWEDTHKRSFIYAGETYLTRIAEQEESYAEIRESLRSARKRKDSTGPSNPPAAKTMRKGSTIGAHPPVAPSNSNNSNSVMPLSAKNLNMHVSAQQSDAPATKPIRNARTSVVSVADTVCTSATLVKDRASTCTVSNGKFTATL